MNRNEPTLASEIIGEEKRKAAKWRGAFFVAAGLLAITAGVLVYMLFHA